jgi:magnesium chelatase family protein
MVGPPGAGKSLLASCMPGILPELTPAEAFGIMYQLQEAPYG